MMAIDPASKRRPGIEGARRFCKSDCEVGHFAERDRSAVQRGKRAAVGVSEQTSKRALLEIYRIFIFRARCAAKFAGKIITCL
jgi:hypothetical protein